MNPSRLERHTREATDGLRKRHVQAAPDIDRRGSRGSRGHKHDNVAHRGRGIVHRTLAVGRNGRVPRRVDRRRRTDPRSRRSTIHNLEVQAEIGTVTRGCQCQTRGRELHTHTVVCPRSFEILEARAHVPPSRRRDARIIGSARKKATIVLVARTHGRRDPLTIHHLQLVRADDRGRVVGIRRRKSRRRKLPTAGLHEGARHGSQGGQRGRVDSNGFTGSITRADPSRRFSCRSRSYEVVGRDA